MGVLAIVVLVGFMVDIEMANADAFARADRSRRFQIDNQALNISMLNQQGAMRAYVNTARPDTLEPYITGRLEFEDARVRLESRATDPGARSRLVKAEGAALTWQQWAESRRLAVQAAGVPLRDVDQNDQGIRLFDAYRTADLELDRWAGADAAAAIADIEARRSVELAGLIGGGAVASLALVLFGLNAWRQAYSRHQELEGAAEDSETRFQILFDQAPVGICWVSADGRMLGANQALNSMLGYGRDELKGMSFAGIAHSEDRGAVRSEFADLLDGKPPPNKVGTLSPHRKDEGASLVVERRLLRKDGEVFWGELTLSPVRDRSGHAQYAITLVQDVTARRTQLAVLQHQAMHDGLTDLPNREMLFERMELALGDVRLNLGNLALLVTDLDGFKAINDRFGHRIGDELLKRVATRLRRNVRSTDTLARLGGDEFALLLPGADQKMAMDAADRLVAALLEPFTIQGHKVSVAASVGGSVFPQNAHDADHLMRKADQAMYEAKRTGSGILLSAS
jgi:diguanylate cyclase (GGDEF)-like protein/PAS domain S-box-containing protein